MAGGERHQTDDWWWVALRTIPHLVVEVGEVFQGADLMSGDEGI